jgi:hypothetical protein
MWNVHYHGVFLEGVSLDRTDQGFRPCFLPVEPPADTNIADVVQKISHRVIRKLRHLGFFRRIAAGRADVARPSQIVDEDVRAPSVSLTTRGQPLPLLARRTTEPDLDCARCDIRGRWRYRRPAGF